MYLGLPYATLHRAAKFAPHSGSDTVFLVIL